MAPIARQRVSHSVSPRERTSISWLAGTSVWCLFSFSEEAIWIAPVPLLAIVVVMVCTSRLSR